MSVALYDSTQVDQGPVKIEETKESQELVSSTKKADQVSKELLLSNSETFTSQLNPSEVSFKPVIKDLKDLETSLEQQYEHLALQEVDILEEIDFKNYLFPNEGMPILVKPHLYKINEPGIIVSAGTERSFFDLALSNPDKCLGLVVRDINPKVKAYVDFNTMLLRISEDRKEYVKLSEIITGEDREKNLRIRIETIRAKVTKTDLPEPVKNYYLKNLENFAKVYFSVDQSWKNTPYFEGVKYFEDDKLFNVLQHFAKAGKIIATIGDINDLEFLKDQNVAIVDVSNIHDYIIMDLKGGENFHPRVIWTWQHPKQSEYFSYMYHPLDVEKRAEFNKLLDELKEAEVLVGSDFDPDPDKTLSSSLKDLMIRASINPDIFNKEMISSYCEKTLTELKDFKSKWMFKDPTLGWICVSPVENQAKKLREMDPSKLKELSKNPEISRFAGVLVEMWKKLDPQKYALFSEVPGWKEAFIQMVKKQSWDPYFRQYFSERPILSELLSRI